MKAYLKGEPYECIEIEVNNRIYPNSSDYSDKNFLSISVKANISGFNALFSCNIRTDEFSIWIDKLEPLINGKANEIVLENMEENFDFKGILDLLGHVLWTCKLKGSDNGPALCFKIKTSIIAVQELRDALKRILLEYPVLVVPD